MLALCCFAPAGVFAQSGGAANLGASYRSWDIDDAAGGTVTVRQLYLPFSATAHAGDRLDLVAFGAYARTTVDFGSDDATLSGITDARLKGVWRPAPQAFLSVGVNLPVGKRTLLQGNGDREVEVAQAMWSPLLGFRARRMAEGFDVDVSAGAATQLSPTLSVGAGAGYVIKGRYDLYETPETTIDFHPGGEASASVGLDWRPAEGAALRLDVAGRTFRDDESEDAVVYRAGNQLEIEALLSRVTPRTSVALRARNVVKEDDKRYEAAADGILPAAVRSANSLWAGGEVYVTATGALALGVEAETGIFGDSDAALSDGSSAAIGPGVRLSGARHRLGVRALWMTGNAENGSVDLSGFDVAGSFTVAF